MIRGPGQSSLGVSHFSNVREIVITAPTVFELLLLLSDPAVDLLPQLTQLQLSSQHLEKR